MNYHNIVKDDMRNGDGLRATLFVSGCSHHCLGCHNPQTWDANSGIEFDDAAFNEIIEIVKKPYINGITFSGGDPLFANNREKIGEIAEYVKNGLNKTVWLYTGYILCFDENKKPFLSNELTDTFDVPDWFNCVDVLVDGPFDLELADQAYHWAGSTNQRVIDLKASIAAGEIILYDNIPEKETEKPYIKNMECCCDTNS